MYKIFFSVILFLIGFNSYAQPVTLKVLDNGNYPVGSNSTDSISANFYSGFGYSDTKKIQLALDLARSKNQKLVIANNYERNSSVWLIDSAILLNSNEYIIIRNAKLKLTDSSRDNIFRTANCGIGITNAASNPVNGITIEGIGNAVLEGADNPRSSGDYRKALTLTPNITSTNSYGTDVGKAGRSQTGDWRNYGAIIAYGTNITVTGLTLSHLHAYGISFSRCKNVIVKNIILDMPGYAAGDVTRLTKNNGGIDFNQSINNVVVDNISGNSADDNAAFNVLNIPGNNAGSLNYYPTGDTTNNATDSIFGISVNNIQAKSFANNIRFLIAANCIARNVTLNNISNTLSPFDTYYTNYGSGAYAANITIGSADVNPLGTVSGFYISNLNSRYAKYGVDVESTLSESFISGINKGSTAYSSTNPVYVDTPSVKFRNVVITPLFPLYGNNVASATAIVPTGNLFHVTGTTSITSITGTGINAGASITIIFDGILTFTNGNNLKLAGNLTTSAGTTITLRYDGTNFYETSRSIN